MVTVGQYSIDGAFGLYLLKHNLVDFIMQVHFLLIQYGRLLFQFICITEC